jgi:hypothetical protein
MLPTDKELSGMTTNERLYAFGLLSQFDDAARHRDRATMIDLLSQVKGKDYTDEAARAVDEMLANPAKFFWHLEPAP